MKRIYPFPKALAGELLKSFIIEDEGYGDITSEILIPEEKQAQARIFTREECVLSGAILISDMYESLGCEVILKANDGDNLAKDQDIALIYGPMKNILLR